MKQADIIKRADHLIEVAGQAIENRPSNGDGRGFVQPIKLAHLRAASLSFLSDVFGESHPFYTEFDKRCSDTAVHRVEMGLGILHAAKNELANGWFETARGVLSAEIFSDVLESARHLLDEKFKDPAAVMVGAVLEGHLRQLAVRHKIATETVNGDRVNPVKADRLNADLCAAGAYGKLDQKSVTSWLDLRNSAAHGHFSAYSDEQVRLMLDGVSHFMTRIPA